jgi:hypothetical protein
MEVYWCMSRSSRRRFVGDRVPMGAVEGFVYRGVEGERNADGVAGDAEAALGVAALGVAVRRLKSKSNVGGVEAASEGGRGGPCVDVLLLLVVTTLMSSASGFSKSQPTPCLTQLPHRGWTSSHWVVSGSYASTNRDQP